MPLSGKQTSKPGPKLNRAGAFAALAWCVGRCRTCRFISTTLQQVAQRVRGRGEAGARAARKSKPCQRAAARCMHQRAHRARTVITLSTQSRLSQRGALHGVRRGGRPLGIQKLRPSICKVRLQTFPHAPRCVCSLPAPPRLREAFSSWGQRRVRRAPRGAGCSGARLVKLKQAGPHARARGEDSSLGRGAAAMRSGACASGGSMRALLCSRCAPERLAATPQRQPSASLGAAPRLASSPYRSLPSSISFLESGLQRMTTRTVSVGAIARARGAPRTVTTYM